MSIADWKIETGVATTPATGVSTRIAPLHQIRSVREQQGVSLRSAARRMHLDVSEAKALEDESSDMLLSTLYLWQKALEVPIGELLVDSEAPLSAPVLKRAQMVRLMKTAVAIQDKADKNKALGRLATMLIEQLVELMPELKDVSPWHAVGHRRSLDEYGKTATDTVSDEWFFGNH